MLFKNSTVLYITFRKNADIGTAMQLDQIINTGNYVQTDDDTCTEIPEIRSLVIECVN